ncbi:MAG TPA: TatD family nuclease-associated radical SAM protein [Lachnospiraceae bacterium]|nr:TatD family nuclease-associated radical SAM protein [Lachnospiraceae bacterium]
MADILYVYGNKLYANLTNRCCLSCDFCIRKNDTGVGNAASLWHEQDPSIEMIKEAVDAFDFSPFEELTFCGYGEPTYALDALIWTAKYLKDVHPGLTLRLNTNGLSDLIHGQPTVRRLAEFIDIASISLNAPTRNQYDALCHPQNPDSFEAMLAFARESKKYFKEVKFTLVDVIPKEDVQACRELAATLGIPLRVREYTKENH